MGIVILSDGYHPIDPEIDTKFSETFNKEYFWNIKEGDDIDEVIKVLGEPLGHMDITSHEDPPSYVFSSDGKCEKWGFAWIGYYVSVDQKGKVISRYTEIHYD
jgi:hypothetical protein